MSAASIGSRVPRDRTILVAGMGTLPTKFVYSVCELAHAEKTVVSDAEKFRGYNRLHPITYGVLWYG